MGGSEMGGAGSLEGIQTVLLLNRNVAKEIAADKAERTVFAFRRAKVFERTFARVLDECNEAVMLPRDITDRYTPEGYFDPYVDFAVPEVELLPEESSGGPDSEM